MLDISYLLNNNISSVLKPKYSLSIRNKWTYLLESSETSITISYSDLCTIMSMVPTVCYFVNKAADNWILDMKMIFC
jgi:hypothetical protein